MSHQKDFTKVQRFRGTADIDISAAVYTGWVTLLTIVASAGEVLKDLEVVLDLAKATTGFAATHTSETIQATVGTYPDGTNLRAMSNLATAAQAGTASASTGLRLAVEYVDDVGIAVMVKLSAEAADCEIPYAVTYRGRPSATITPVAAG